MKTFGNYLLDLIKAIAFFAGLIWLVSCDETTKRIRLLQQYEDSIGITKLQLRYIDEQRDSISERFLQQYPAIAFDKRDTRASDERFDSIKYQYLEDLNRYKRIVDSLKYTLQ